MPKVKATGRKSAAGSGAEAAMALGGSAVKEFEEDLGAMEGGVYLLGEDRFEDSAAMRT